MQNNARIGGILSIIAGGLGCLGAIMLVCGIAMIWAFSAEPYYTDAPPEEFWMFMIAVYGVFGFIGLLVSVLAIIGGVFGIRRKNWGLALAGSIAGTLTFFPCGIPAIIFTALGKLEFDASQPAAPQT